MRPCNLRLHHRPRLSSLRLQLTHHESEEKLDKNVYNQTTHRSLSPILDI